MLTYCGQCNVPLIQGSVAPTGGVLEDEQRLSFITSMGTPTSLNPIKAVLQGLHEDPAYHKEVCSLRAGVCPKCGRVEFFIDAEDLAKVIALPVAKK
jgi:hypothetical protein